MPDIAYQKILIFCICMVAFMIPFSIALTNIGIIAAIIVIIAYRVYKRNFSINAAGTGYFLLGFLLVALASMLNAVDKGVAITGLRKILKYYSIIVIFSEIKDKRNTIRQVLYCLMAAAFFISLDGIFQYYKGFDLIKHSQLTYTLGAKRITGSMHNPNDLAVFMASCIAIYFASLFFNNGKPFKKKLLLAVSLVICIIASIMTFYRGLILFYFFMIAAVFLMRRNIKFLAASIIAVILTYILLPAGTLSWLKDNPNIIDFFIDHSRYLHWKTAINMLKAHPFIGIGINNFVPSYIIYRGPDDGFVGWYAHNLYLHMLGEVGLAGFGIFIAIMICGFKNCLRNIKQKALSDNWVSYGALFSVSAFLITGIFESNLFYSNLAVFFWILFSVMLFLPSKPYSA